jgi:hypothetical protein
VRQYARDDRQPVQSLLLVPGPTWVQRLNANMISLCRAMPFGADDDMN